MLYVSEETLDIDSLCRGDKDLSEALKRAFFINPGRIPNTAKSFEEIGKKMEQGGNRLLARVNYEIAGRLALMNGDAESIRRFFSKSAELESDEHLAKIFKTLSSKCQEAANAAEKYYDTIASQAKADSTSG